jgi:Zn-dependent peptidase ImmA (M78 family)
LRAIGLPVEYVKFKLVDEYLYRNLKTGVQFLAVNSQKRRARQRFSTAHGLGHYFLHPKMGGALSVGRRKSYADRQADAFAEELLMPEHRFRKFFEGFSFLGYRDLIGYLAVAFEVSKQAVRVRIDHLRLFNGRREK